MFDYSTKKNNIYYINENKLGFVPDVYVRPLGENENVNNVYPYMNVLFHGEVKEKVAGLCRHFHYFVAKKNKIIYSIIYYWDKLRYCPALIYPMTQNLR